MDLIKHGIAASIVLSILMIAACGSGNQPASNTQVTVDVLYGRKCAVCHGREGNAMASGSPDLTKSTISKEMIIATITQGKGKMPSQKDVLTKEEISALADFVIGLRK
ncbi:MAG: c-type cytochrome [Flavobacteriales bacterium]|jgi:mono/diheme cytochrome c family protein